MTLHKIWKHNNPMYYMICRCEERFLPIPTIFGHPPRSQPDRVIKGILKELKVFGRVCHFLDRKIHSALCPFLQSTLQWFQTASNVLGHVLSVFWGLYYFIRSHLVILWLEIWKTLLKSPGSWRSERGVWAGIGPKIDKKNDEKPILHCAHLENTLSSGP